jgi:hypothetical protein
MFRGRTAKAGKAVAWLVGESGDSGNRLTHFRVHGGLGAHLCLRSANPVGQERD